IGGLVIGTMQHDMPIGEAAKVYTLLTVGDGLVSQIPALLISTAAGIIVSRAASEGNLSKELTTQLLGDPKTLVIGAAFILFIGLLPGLPILPFWAIGRLFLFLAYKRHEQEEEQEMMEAQQSMEQPEQKEDRVEDYLLLDTLELDIGYSLIPMVEVEE